jgi:hypothetical protein
MKLLAVATVATGELITNKKERVRRSFCFIVYLVVDVTMGLFGMPPGTGV